MNERVHYACSLRLQLWDCHPAPARGFSSSKTKTPTPAGRGAKNPPSHSTHLAEKVLPVDAGCGVALQLHLGRGGLQRLCLWDAGDFVVGAFNPVAPKLGQQDEGEGPFSPQDLKGDSVESHPHYTPPGTPGQLPSSDLGTTQTLHGSRPHGAPPMSRSQRMGVGTESQEQDLGREAEMCGSEAVGSNVL